MTEKIVLIQENTKKKIELKNNKLFITSSRKQITERKKKYIYAFCLQSSVWKVT